MRKNLETYRDNSAAFYLIAAKRRLGEKPP